MGPWTQHLSVWIMIVALGLCAASARLFAQALAEGEVAEHDDEGFYDAPLMMVAYPGDPRWLRTYRHP